MIDGSSPSFGRYVLLEPLGARATSQLYLAQRIGADELCVVKILPEGIGAGEVPRERFLREARLASLLDHRNISRIIDVGFEPRLYIAMELVDGQDLLAVEGRLASERRRIPAEISVSVIVETLEALHHAHELRDPAGEPLELVHRDVSARNVMVTYDGAVKLIDFGVAHARIGEFRTAPGMVMGTLRYMSPEQAAAGVVDRRSDVYSTGVLLWELLAGRPVITALQPAEILAAIAMETAPRLRTVDASLPAKLEVVVARALEKSPEARFSSAAEMAAALREAVPAWCEPRRGEAGGLVSELFAKEKAERAALRRKAEAGVLTGEATMAGDSPFFQPTITAPRERVRVTGVEVRAPSLRARRPRRSARGATIALAASAVALALVAALFVLVPARRAEEVPAQAVVPAVPPATPSPRPVAAKRVESERARERVPERAPPPVEKAIAAKKTVASVPAQEPVPVAVPERVQAVVELDSGVQRLKKRVAELRASADQAAGILELSERIKKEADRVRDPAARKAVKSQAHTSGMMSDLEGLAAAIDKLEQALD